jgi:hypothetical protein
MKMKGLTIIGAVLWIRIHWIQIRIQHFKWIRIQSFDDQKLKNKKLLLKKILFFWSKIAIFTYPEASIKDVQATE